MSLSFFTPARTVLLIADEALCIYSTSYKGVRLVETVPWTAENFEKNVATILSKDCGNKPVLIINDMVEQHYRKERIPAVGAMDRASVLQRKLVVAFPNYPIRAALPLKEKTAKTDKGGAASIYIFAAVPNSEPFAKTMGTTRASLVPIAGFGLLPVESSDMVKALAAKISRREKKKSVWAVFIGQHQNGGLRQIVTRNGEVALTRMTPIVDKDSDPEQWVGEVNQEFKATMSYLSRFGYAEEDGLDVIAITNPATGELLENTIDTPCNFKALTVVEAAQLLGIPLGRQDDLRHADILHVAWVGRKRSMLLPMKAREIDAVSRPRQMAVAASAVLILAAGFLGYQMLDQYQDMSVIHGDLDEANQRKAQLDVQYQIEVKRKEDLGFDVRLVQSSLMVYDELEKKNIKTLRLFNGVGHALGRDLRLDQIVVKKDKVDLADKILNPGEMFSDTLYQAKMHMTYPSTTNIDKGNQEVRDLRDRLQMFLPSHTIEVTKFLKDYEYTEQVVVETGDLNKKDVVQDFVAEISIKGPVL
ncbi:MAG: hypothetical protein DHS20C02_02840 [Micavibrio sp.]|nr:MAG: hypothetical protein DHS20C02_02840 [Micavibrio sp.]